MPAYRSSAETEIRTAVVEKLRDFRPEARIIHEINASFGGCRIDVLAVSPADIVAAEIKSKKDKLDRLPRQIKAMRAVAHTTIAAIHSKFLIEKKTNEWASEYQRDGVHYLRAAPDESKSAVVWVYGGLKAQMENLTRHHLYRWELRRHEADRVLPHGALGILWADELRWLVAQLRIDVPKRASTDRMRRAILWHACGQDVTRGVCAALRRRDCIEADPVIHEDWRPVR